MIKRVIIPLIVTWVFYIVACFGLIQYVKTGYEKATDKKVVEVHNSNIKKQDKFAGETASELEQTSSATTQERAKKNPLLKVEDEQLNELIQQELKAMADGNVEILKSLDLYEKSYEDESIIKKAAEVIDSYENIQNYSKKGLLPDTYLIFAVADVKLSGCKTLAPTMLRFYVEKNKAGEFHINTKPAEDFPSATYMYLANIQNEEDVLELIAKVNKEFVRACQKDKNLKKIVTGVENGN